MSNDNPKPILLIEAPAYVDDLLAIFEGDMTLNDLIRNASKIKGWNFLVIQTQKPEFDYKVFYPPSIQETVKVVKDSPGDCQDKPTPAASIDELSKNAWAEYFSFEKEDQEGGGISKAFVMVPKSQPVPKVAKTQQEAFDMEEKFADVPHGWIQWKGTEVCMDVHCKCGKSFHIDATFAYNVKCPECETIYAVNGHVELIELLDTSVNSVTAT